MNNAGQTVLSVGQQSGLCVDQVGATEGPRGLGARHCCAGERTGPGTAMGSLSPWGCRARRGREAAIKAVVTAPSASLPLPASARRRRLSPAQRPSRHPPLPWQPAAAPEGGDSKMAPPGLRGQGPRAGVWHAEGVPAGPARCGAGRCLPRGCLTERGPAAGRRQVGGRGLRACRSAEGRAAAVGRGWEP